MFALWHDYLYEPVLNFLFFLYSGPAFGNLGVAIIELTICLRLLLLPFSVLNERTAFRFEKLNARIMALERDFKADSVKRKEKIRELLKEHKVSYWSKVIVLGVQLLVLILLYQVFNAGLRLSPNDTLYAFVDVPPRVNTMFFGFDLAAKSVFWAGAVAVVLFAEIYAIQKRREHLVTKSDVIYLIFFPIFTFGALMLLPMVKSLFIMTSMLFSLAVLQIRSSIFKVERPIED